MNNPFNSATFIGATSHDGYGFDDLTIGVKQVETVPEPSTILGIGMALGFAALFKNKGANSR